MGAPIEVFSDMSERLYYNLPDFPLYIYKDKLIRYGYAAACHWHPDLEFILVLEGEMDFFVNGNTEYLCAGNGIFVNSKRLHYGFSTDKTDCTFIVVVIHPSLLYENSQTVKVYLEEKFGTAADDFILLDSRIGWQQNVLLLLSKIYEEMKGDIRNPLHLLAQAVFLCASMGDHIQQTAGGGTDTQWKTVIWNMTGFIHRNYDEKISVDDIAASGMVCRSKCCELFHEYVGQTPNTYLMNYRIIKSCELLRETKRTISEIAASCGFQSAGYFSRVFRKETGLTPRDFRRKIIASLTVTPD
ncbi:AraC family transcriptional regulator [Lachnospiraceae bacterium 54-53]